MDTGTDGNESAAKKAGGIPLLNAVSGIWGRVENWSLVGALGLLMALPLIDMLLRQFDTGLAASDGTRQKLVLVVAMMGSAVAARESRLLSLSSLTSFLKGPWKVVAQSINSSVSLFVTVMLCVGAYQFLFREDSVHTGDEAKNFLIFGIPVWTVLIAMPLGFALISLRMFWQSGDKWALRLIPLAFGGFLYWFFNYDLDWELKEGLVWPMLILLFLATAAGAPLYIAIAGSALILNWGWIGDEIGVIVQNQAQEFTKFTASSLIVTLPLFTLAGYFLAQGNSSKRLIELIQSVFGGIRGGAAIVTVLVCAFFTTFTGASGVTILALGGLLMPVLKSAHYSERSSLGLLTGAGSLGVLFPPCLPLILYAVVASNVKVVNETGMVEKVSISLEQIFMGGALPGAILVLMTIVWGVWRQPKVETKREPIDWGRARRAFLRALGELMLPVVALFTLFSGLALPHESAAIAALYAFCVYLVDGIWVRKVRIADELPKMVAECGLLVGGVLLILGVAMGLTDYFVLEMIPERLTEWAKENIDSKYTFLLALNIVLVLVGCLMDIFSAIVVVVPLIVPLGAAFGIDPIHLGIVFLANLQLGYLTPPIGMNLFLASYRFGIPISQVIRASLPLLFIFIIGVLIITYIPALSLWLPSLLGN